MRVINVPKRGIGNVTISNITAKAEENNISMFEAITGGKELAFKQLITKLQEIFLKINDSCNAIYKGGSRVDPAIDAPNDYDYICFAKPLHRHFILSKLYKLGFRQPGSFKSRKQIEKHDENYVDFSQTRVYPYTQIT
jgi:hypothetical protein